MFVGNICVIRNIPKQRADYGFQTCCTWLNCVILVKLIPELRNSFNNSLFKRGMTKLAEICNNRIIIGIIIRSVSMIEAVLQMQHGEFCLQV